MQLLVQLLPQDLALLLRAGLLGEELLALRRCLALQLLALCRGLGLQLLPLLLAHADATLDHLRLARRHGHRHLLPVHGDGGGARPLAPRLQLGAQAFDLLLELAQHGILGVLVDLGLVLDPLGAVRVPQRGQRLVVVHVGGADGGNHDGARVAAERVLQKQRQRRVAVGNLLGPLGGVAVVGQRRNNVAQRRERHVDGRALLEARAGGARGVGTLRPRKIDQVDGRRLVGGLAGSRVHLGLREHELEDGVGARRGSVHVGGCHGPGLGGGFHQAFHGRVVSHGVLGQALHEEARLGVLANLQVAGLWVVEVADLFHVNLERAHLDLEGQVRVRVGVDAVENLLARDHHDSLVLAVADHGVALSGACLPVGKQRGVVALIGVVENALAKIAVHNGLAGVARVVPVQE
mmetsp:Transcript_17034/g.64481  ORF Transcript_17034/g.64481 Transcript_17034/m.64481 type:complete len:407 (-) Transcript_17034:213-1433(-)